MESENYEDDKVSGAYTEVYVWGGDHHGQLGLGQKYIGKTYSSPKICSFNLIIKEVSCGEEHAAFITSKGYIYTMGSNARGRLGIGNKSIKQSSSPCLVEACQRYKCKSISCGWGHTLAVMETGEIFSWGVGEHGALGNGTTVDIWQPERIYLDAKIQVKARKASAGARHSAFISEFGNLFVCGDGDAGQLGTGKRDSELIPIQNSLISDIVVDVACGISHTLILTDMGRVYATGANTYGQLGLGNKKNTPIPARIKEFDSQKVIKISCGQHSAALTEKGDIYIWGTGIFGEFLSPVRYNQQGTTFKDISVGGFFGAAIDEKNTVWTWGSNTSGELGVGDYEPRTHPFPNINLQAKKVQKLSCGGSFVIALGPIKKEGLNGFLEEGSVTKAFLAGLKTPPKHDYRSTYSQDEGFHSSSITRGRLASKSPSTIKNYRDVNSSFQKSPNRLDTETKLLTHDNDFLDKSEVRGYYSKSPARSRESKTKPDDPFMELVLRQKTVLENNLKQERIEKRMLENNLLELKRRLRELQEGPEGLQVLSESLNRQAERFDELKQVYQEECKHRERLANELKEERHKNLSLTHRLNEKEEVITRLENKMTELEITLKEKMREMETLKTNILKQNEKQKHQNAQQEEEINRLQRIIRDLTKEYESSGNLGQIERARTAEFNDEKAFEDEARELESRITEVTERMDQSLALLEREQNQRLKLEEEVNLLKSKDQQNQEKIKELIEQIDALNAKLEECQEIEHENNSRMLMENDQLNQALQKKEAELIEAKKRIIELEEQALQNEEKNKRLISELLTKEIEKQAEEFKRKALNNLFGPAKRLSETLSQKDVNSLQNTHEYIHTKPEFLMSGSSTYIKSRGDTLVEPLGPLDLEKLRQQIYQEKSNESVESSEKNRTSPLKDKILKVEEDIEHEDKEPTPTNYILETSNYELERSQPRTSNIDLSDSKRDSNHPSRRYKNIIGLYPVEREKEQYKTPNKRETEEAPLSHSSKRKKLEAGKEQPEKENQDLRSSSPYKMPTFREGQESSDVSNSSEYAKNISVVKERLSTLQKNKQVLENKMQEFERKLKNYANK